MARKKSIDYDDWDVEGYEETPKRQIRKKRNTKKTPPQTSRYQQERIYPNIEGYDPYGSNPYAQNGHGQRVQDEPHDSRLDEIRKDRDVDDGEDMRILSSLERSRYESEEKQNNRRRGSRKNSRRNKEYESNSVYGDGYRQYSSNEEAYYGNAYDNDYGYDDEYELDVGDDHHLGTVAKVIIALITVVGIVAVFIFWGYWNTDFDKNGTAYIVPLEMHYERHYLQESDKVLKMIMDIDSSLAQDTALLPTKYSEKSTKLTQEMNELKAQTTQFSKYVNVPDNFQTYHSLLINFSLKTQEFMKNLLNNYASEDYEAFRQSGMQDYENYFYQVKEARKDLDSVAFANLSSHKGVLDSDKDSSSTKSSSESSSSDSSQSSSSNHNSYNNSNNQSNSNQSNSSNSNNSNDNTNISNDSQSENIDSNSSNNSNNDSDSSNNNDSNSYGSTGNSDGQMPTNDVVTQQIVNGAANSMMAGN